MASANDYGGDVVVLSFREALGGKWATSPIGWTIILPPSILLVAVQETGTPFPSWLFVLISALAQHIAGPVIVGGIAAFARRRHKVIPTAWVFVIWALVGVARGLVAGAIAQAFAGVDPGYAFRIVSWVAICVIWGSMTTYSLAQFGERRVLVKQWGGVKAHLDSEQSVAGKSAEQLRMQLIGTVQQTVGPVLDEIRASLAAASGGMKEAGLSSIRFKLALVGREVGQVLDPTSEQPEVAEQSSWAELVSALDFQRSRPVRAVLLTTLALAPLVIPDAIRIEGWLFGLESLIALLVAGAVMVISLTTAQLWGNATKTRRLVVTCVGYFLSGIAASATLLLLHWTPLQAHEIALIVVLPIGTIFALYCGSGAIGLSLANSELSRKIGEAKKESASLHKKSDATVRRVTKQLTDLMHGPIQGRLSACAMALNFLAASDDPTNPARIAAVTEAVLNHLDLASRDLAALGKA